MKTLETQVVSASKWAYLSQISNILTPLTVILLAFILVPEDFGLVTIATLIVKFSQLFWDLGLNKALIQSDENIEKAANVVFWSNMFLGILIYLFVFFSSGPIADFYQDIRLQQVIQIQGCLIIINAASSVQITLFQRELNFKPYFLVRLLTTTIPFIVAIPLALVGQGYWALVIGYVTTALSQVIIIWKISKWRPKFDFDTGVAKRMLSFGFWVTLEFFLGWIITSLDEIILSAYFGLHILGIYSTGKTLVSTIFNGMFGSFPLVMFSFFSRIRFEMNRFQESLLIATKLHAMLALPMGAGLFLVAEFFSRLVFQESWLGIDRVIGVLAISYGLAYLVSALPSAYRAIGKADIQVKILSLQTIYSIPAFLLAATTRLDIFLWMHVSVQLFVVPFHLFYMRNRLMMNLTELFRSLRYIILALVVMTLSVTLGISILANSSDILKLIVSITIGIFIFGLFLIPERNFIRNIILVLRKKEGQSI